MLRGLPPDVLDRLGAAMRHRHFDKGQLIASAGDPIESLLIVASGRLRIVQASITGREQIVREAGPGEILGELGMFAAARYEGDLLAANDAEACELPRKETLAAISQSPESAMILVEYLSRRLARAEQLIGDLGARDVAGRLAAELVRAADATSCPACACGHRAHGASSSQGATNLEITLTGSWAEMASRIGTTPESLSRRLRSLEDDGIISRVGSGGVVTILDMERLRDMAGMY